MKSTSAAAALPLVRATLRTPARQWSKLLPAAFLFTALLLAAASTRAQKPYPVELLGLLGKIQVPTATAACYEGCATKTDPANGSVSVVNADPTYKDINDELDKITKAALDGARAQVAALQQAQAQPPSAAPSAAELAILKKMGAAQTAAGQINQLTMEMAQKVAKLDKTPIDNVPMGANCPEVQQGGYAGPTCDCLTKKEMAYQQARDVKYNVYLREVTAIINEYLAKIKVQSAIIDDFEQTAKYGDAVSNPVYKQLVGSVQRQAIGGVAAILGVSTSNWEDAAKMYARVVNAKSGASVGCAGHKG